MPEHEDKGQDAEDLRPVVESLVQAINTLASELDNIKNAHGALSKLVTDDLIGGIHSMWQTNVRNGRIEGLKSKYGDKLQGHFDLLKELTPEGTDHWGALNDMTEGMSDEELDSHIDNLSAGLKSKFDKLRSSGASKEEALEEVAPGSTEGGEEAPAKVETTSVTKVEKPTKEAALDEEPPKKSKDELIADKLKTTKGFKLR